MDQSSTKPATPSYRVLLVEDDIDLGESLQEALKADQISLTLATNGRSALETIRQNGYDLVLLDLGLPGMDGFELLEQLKGNSDWKDIPVIILTAANAMAGKVRGFDLGAVDYLTKPFQLVELRARIRAALRTQQLQQQLLESNRKLDAARLTAETSASNKADFLASMSHEIRTPMNGVIAMTSLLMQTELAPEQRDFVETIRSSGESLLTIINDILNFSKIESGKLELEQRPMKLRECVEETLDLLASKAAEKKIDLVYQIDPGTPAQVVGDATRLGQILVNLVNNAIKFTPSGEVAVAISSRRLSSDEPDAPARSEFQFSVRDTGIGIPADRIDRLFLSFSQADSSISRRYGGTGLGLAICKGLVELMGGRMWIESKEGQGSAFHFTIPLPVTTESNPDFVEAQPTLAGLRVLVVEDGKGSRTAIVEQLRQWGMTPVEAGNAGQAIAEVKSTPGVALAIVDRQLPDQDGIALAVELRKHRNHHSLPTIILNSVGTPLESSESLPPDSLLLNKPVKPAQLLSALLQFKSGTKPAQPRNPHTVSKLDFTLAEKFPLRILLTDDNVINQKVALRLLQQLGYKADKASNGREAIEALEREPYDLILMDVQMPEIDGLEATRRIRQRQRDADSPGNFQRPIVIIAMTANAMHGDREKCVAAGMDDYLPKPVRPETLQAMLQKHSTRPVKTTGDSSTTEWKQADSVSASNSPSLQVLPAPEASNIPTQVVEQPPVAMDRLNEFSGGNLENYNELVALYIKQTTGQLEQIHAAFAENNSECASRLAHSCAGASATCGMSAIVPLLRRVEQLTRDDKLEAAVKLMPAIEHEFERLKNYLDTHKPIALAG